MQFGTPKTVAEAIAPFQKIQTNLKNVLTAQKTKRTAAENLIATTRKQEEAAKTKSDKVCAAQSAVIETAINEELQAQALFDDLQKLFDTSAPVDVSSMTPADKANAGHTLES